MSPSSTVYLSWPVLLTLGSAVGTIGLIRYLIRYRDKPGARWFVLTLVGQVLFCFAYGIGLTVFDPAIRWWFEVGSLVGLGWLGVPFLGFALSYTGRGQIVDSWLYRSLFVIPLSVTVLLPLNPWHGLFWTGFEVDPTFGVATVSYSFGLLALLVILASGVIVGVGTVLLFDTVLSYGPLFRTEAMAVALSPIPPILGLFPWLFGFGPAPNLNTIAVFLLPHVVLDAYAFGRSDMFEFHPGTKRAAERSALSELASPVFVLDEDGRIVDLNDDAHALIESRADPVTRPVSQVLGVELDHTGESRQLTLRRNGERRTYSVESAPLTDSAGDHVGYTLLFQNITDQVRRKERLSVLNRVLRHNLRNDLSVVSNYINEAARVSSDGDVPPLVDRADAKISDLAATGRKARTIEERIGTGRPERTEIDLPEMLSAVTADIGSRYPEATVTVDCARGLDLYASPGILEPVVTELLENAIEHGHDEHPTVNVGVEAESDEALVVRVRDDGPGIPDHELRTLGRGEETALDHGSGLGLWLVRWGVLRLGGQVDFEADSGGTVVTLTVPRNEHDSAH